MKLVEDRAFNKKFSCEDDTQLQFLFSDHFQI